MSSPTPDTTPRQNRVDPFGDLHAVHERGLFTGNRGCLVDDTGRLARHHNGQLWIVCVTSYKDWRSPLAAPRRWTPIFFLDEAVALAAGHRPCGLCRREDYISYRDAVRASFDDARLLSANDLNRMLSGERLNRGRGLSRAADRKIWTARIEDLPDGTVIVGDDSQPILVVADRLWRFGFEGWKRPRPRPATGPARVLTPPTSVAALSNGYAPTLHPSIQRSKPPTG